MSFSDLLSGYAKSKSNPPIERKLEPNAPKSHPLKDVLTSIRAHVSTNGIASKTDNSSVRNLGILVMIIDDFPNELLWRLWLDMANADNSLEENANIRMWFHAKCPEKVRSPWVKERLIRSAHFKPEWGSIEITKAMAHMLHEALFDAPDIYKFCFASESCIPIRSVSETLRILYTENTDNVEGAVNSSWLNYTDIPNNGYAKQLQYDPLARALPDGCVYKASQWVLLSRTHAVAVIDLMQQVGHITDNPRSSVAQKNLIHNVGTAGASTSLPVLSPALFSAFELVGKASDEMFFPSCLAIVGAIAPSVISGDIRNDCNAATKLSGISDKSSNAASVRKQQITYCDWTDNAKSPQEYSTFPSALVTALINYAEYKNTAKNKKVLDTLHIHPDQQNACFMRKIKFPILYGTESLNEAQHKFLSEWLPFIMSADHSDLTIASANHFMNESVIEKLAASPDKLDNNTIDKSQQMEKYMLRAQHLYHIIANYPAPERVIKKRSLPEEESDRYSYRNNHSRYDYRENSRDRRNAYDSYDRSGSGYDRYDPNSGYRDNNHDRSNRQGNHGREYYPYGNKSQSFH